ncbi:MAG TPA: sulfatase-like hydrolase/transferase, partial [Erysipelothrix sp.]|nr:sulfatase-like hydrolase/transferase [Erysipelothrix sp.]
SGWQSDLVMMQKVVSDLNNKDDAPQMTYVITSTTHFPYDKASHLGDKYSSKVLEVYPEAPEHIVRYLSKAIELDLAMEYFLSNYKDIDNTVLALFSDHHPLNMPLK